MMRWVHHTLVASISLSIVLALLNIAATPRTLVPPMQTTAKMPVQVYSDLVDSELSRRLTIIEGQHLDVRMAVIESDIATFKWMMGGVLVTVVGQFFLPLMGRRKPEAA